MSQIENISGLQSILEAVNALPEAGGGGEPPTCQVTVINNISADYGDSGYIRVAYTTVEDGAVIGKRLTVPCEQLRSFSCLCNSVIVVHESGSRVSHSLTNMEILGDSIYSEQYFGNFFIFAIKLTAEANENASLNVTG